MEESIYQDIMQIASNRSAPGIILLGRSGKLIYCNGLGQKVLRELVPPEKKNGPKPKGRSIKLPPLIKKLHAGILSNGKKPSVTVIPMTGREDYYCVSAHRVRPPVGFDTGIKQPLTVVMLIEHFIPNRKNHQSLNFKRYNLSKQQVKIAILLKKGLTNKEMAQNLSISTETVHDHIAGIMKKLGVTTRCGIVGEVFS